MYLRLEEATENVENFRDEFKDGEPELMAINAPFHFAKLERLRTTISKALATVDEVYRSIMGTVQSISHFPGTTFPSTFAQRVQDRGQKIREYEMQIRIAVREGDFDLAERMLNSDVVDSFLMVHRLRRWGRDDERIIEFVENYAELHGLE